MTNTFLPRLFLYHDPRDKKMVKRICSQLGPYSCYIWSFPEALKEDDSLQAVLTKESELLKTDWICGVLSSETVNAVWLNALIKGKNFPILRQAGTRKLVAVLKGDLNVKVPARLPVVNFAANFEEALAKLLNIVLSEANDLRGFPPRVLKTIKAIRGGQADVWAFICGLSALTHEVIRRRYILENSTAKKYRIRKQRWECGINSTTSALLQNILLITLYYN